MNNDISIRLAHPNEHQVLEALMRRASLANEDDRSALLANPEVIALPIAEIAAGRVYIAARGADVVGFANILIRSNGEIDLDGLFVDPPLWKQGIGRALLEHCTEVARNRGAAALHVIGNPHAERFYLACGFFSNGLVKTQFGSGIHMQKYLVTSWSAHD